MRSAKICNILANINLNNHENYMLIRSLVSQLKFEADKAQPNDGKCTRRMWYSAVTALVRINEQCRQFEHKPSVERRSKFTGEILSSLTQHNRLNVSTEEIQGIIKSLAADLLTQTFMLVSSNKERDKATANHDEMLKNVNNLCLKGY